MSDDDEWAKESETGDSRGELADIVEDVDLYHWTALKTTLLQAASHGHRDLVRDILQQTSRARTVAAAETGLYDLINHTDPQVAIASRTLRCTPAVCNADFCFVISYEVCNLLRKILSKFTGSYNNTVTVECYL